MREHKLCQSKLHERQIKGKNKNIFFSIICLFKPELQDQMRDHKLCPSGLHEKQIKGVFPVFYTIL